MIDRLLQKSIETWAKKPMIRLTPYQLLFAGKFTDQRHLIKSAKYLQNELPSRIAKQIVEFQNLPYIVLTNPHIFGVYKLYTDCFNILRNTEPVNNITDEHKFQQLLVDQLFKFSNVVYELAIGFKQSSTYIDTNFMNQFLDKTLSSRLAIRILADHYIKLRFTKDSSIGVIALKFNIKDSIKRIFDKVSKQSWNTFGQSSNLVLNGHDTCFHYIVSPFEYIIEELLKNSMRATVQFNNLFGKNPNIEVTICSCKNHFIVKISDRGGGISENRVDQIFNYTFTTSNENNLEKETFFTDYQSLLNPMYGFGFGLSIARAYSIFLGGSLNYYNMPGYGFDAYIDLKHLNQDDGPTFLI